MIDVNKLKREQSAKLAEMRELATTVEKRDDKSLTPEELTRSSELQARVAALTTEISQAEMLNAEEARSVAEGENGHNRGSGDRGDGDGDGDDTEIRSFEEFFSATLRAAHGHTDERLQQRSVNTGTGEDGGFLMPREINTNIIALMPKTGIMRNHAEVIPASAETPDAALDLTAMDQSGTKGVFGGMKFHWTGEEGEVDESGEPKFKQITLEPQNVSGWLDISNKALQNISGISARLQVQIAQAIQGAVEHELYKGNGVAKPKGVLNSDAVIKLKRKTTGKITYQDLVDMESRVAGEDFAWYISRSVLTDLRTMVADSTDSLVWQPNAVVGSPMSILGHPVFFQPYAPVLGEYGDILLADLSYYAIKDGSGLSIFFDPYSQRKANRTRMYVSVNVDGQSLITSPMLAEDGKTTVSPFVALAK